jgi:hypothetical protein
MGVKDELRTLVKGDLGEWASDIFLRRVFNRIESTADDAGSLLETAEWIGKMVTLFIDEGLGARVLEDLRLVIGTAKGQETGNEPRADAPGGAYQTASFETGSTQS